jgi:hypothetical protein
MSILSNEGSVGPNRQALAHSKTFPSPFLDYASLEAPQTIEEAYEMAETMFYTNRTFAQAMEYIVAYFTGTDISLVAKDEEKTNEYKDYLEKTINLQSQLYLIGRDAKIYGNSCVSVLAPFKRFLTADKGESGVYPLDELDWEFDIRKGFKYTDPKTDKPATCQVPIDRPTQKSEDIIIKRWPLKQLKAVKSPYSNRTTYYYEFSQQEEAEVREGKASVLYDIPWGMVEAIREGKLFEFSPGMLYHLAADNLCDTQFEPWGLPPAIASFRDAYLTSILKRNNEVIALDHMLPLKMVSPAGNSTGSGVDFMRNTNLGTFGQVVLRSIERAKKDPSGWMYFPVPINYQVMNGEGAQFVNPALMENAQAEFLNGLGVPVEMYRKNMSSQSAPFAARLFEAGEVVFFEQLNSVCKWIINRISAVLSWDHVDAELTKPTHADDLDRRMILLQMMMGGIASEQDVLSLFGLDWKDTFKKRMAEQEYKMKEEKKIMERMQKLQENEMIMNMPPGMAGMDPSMMGGMPPGAMPPGGGTPVPPGPPVNGMAGPPAGGNQGIDVQSYMADAQAKAQEIAQTYPLGSLERRQVLSQLKASDPNMHAQVVALLDQLTNEAEAQGRAQLRQPAPPAGGMPM